MKLSDYIAEFLIKNGCTHVFGYQGGAVTHIVDSLYRYPKIKFVGTYHEQAAAFAAEGYARVKNSIGVAVATSGPGATNLITGIGSAYFDSVPCLYLTGQVNTYEYKGELKVRQLGFQETDIVSIVKPITKYAVQITDPSTIRYELEKAVAIASSGRKGPVLLDIPMDIQRAQVDDSSLPPYPLQEAPQSEIDIDRIVELLNGSQRPVILVGSGVRLSGAAELFGKVSARFQVPVVSSLMGLDAASRAGDCYFGMIGVYGSRCANFTIANSDLILALGTRLDTRQTGTNPESFARAAKLIRIDIDSDELSRKVKPDEYAVRADAGEFLAALYEHLDRISVHPQAWLEKAREYRNRYPSFSEQEITDPNFAVAKLSELMDRDTVICLDVGQNQMWGAQSLGLADGRRLLTSGGMGSMGFALPCAIGAYYAGNRKTVYAVAGDGGVQMNVQELELLKRNHIPVKVIILNNRSLGMIRHFQEMYFESRYVATVTDYAAPDFCSLAKAYGIQSMRVENSGEFEKMRSLLADAEPAVIEIMLPQITHVIPKLAVGRPIEEQEPLLDRAEFLSNMLIEPFEADNG